MVRCTRVCREGRKKKEMLAAQFGYPNLEEDPLLFLFFLFPLTLILDQISFSFAWDPLTRISWRSIFFVLSAFFLFSLSFSLFISIFSFSSSFFCLMNPSCRAAAAILLSMIISCRINFCWRRVVEWVDWVRWIEFGLTKKERRQSGENQTLTLV